MQHGCGFAHAASTAPKQANLWHHTSSGSSLSYTASGPLQNLQALFPSQSFTSAAGQGSNAISGRLLPLPKQHTSAQAANSQTNAKAWAVQQVSGQASLQMLYWHSLSQAFKPVWMQVICAVATLIGLSNFTNSSELVPGCKHRLVLK